MAANVAPLTDARIRNAKAREDGNPHKLADGAGLSLWVLPSGRYWRFKYRFGGKEKSLALGVYPEVKASEARQRRDEARALLRNDIDPGAVRKAEKRQRKLASATSFEAVAGEWLSKQKKSMAPATYEKAQWTLDKLICPYIGKRPVSEIEAPEVLELLRRLEARGKHETAHRTKQRIGQVMRYAIATGRAKRDPSADLKGALAPAVTTSRAAITDPAKIGELLRALDGYTGHFVTSAALRLAPLVFVRPGELRAAEWSELDLEAAEWRIPASKMKMGEEHVIPLSRQALAVIRELQPLTGGGRYLFPSIRSSKRPMSNNTVLAALRRMGFEKEEMSGHGFRALASTRLNELGWKPEVIERQLAHAERNRVRAAYNRASYMAERRQMMQAWADYLDALKNGARVIPIGAGVA